VKTRKASASPHVRLNVISRKCTSTLVVMQVKILVAIETRRLLHESMRSYRLRSRIQSYSRKG
jgi:hypothetical protein